MFRAKVFEHRGFEPKSDFSTKTAFRAKVFEDRGFEPKSEFSVENFVSSRSLVILTLPTRGQREFVEWGRVNARRFFSSKAVFRAKVFENRGFEPKSEFSAENCVSSQSL